MSKRHSLNDEDFRAPSSPQTSRSRLTRASTHGVLTSARNPLRQRSYGRHYSKSRRERLPRIRLGSELMLFVGIFLGVLFAAATYQYSDAEAFLSFRASLEYGIGDYLPNVNTTMLSEILRVPYLRELAFGEIFEEYYEQVKDSVTDAKSLAEDIFKELGVEAKHPAILMPGFITSGLEVWAGTECMKGNFRKRIWGNFSMIRAALLNPDCWVQHLMLDPETGKDPEGVKLRPADGFEAADFFMPGYWVWAPVIEAFGALGYDKNNMALLPYDWRLGPRKLEERDRFFTRMKNTIEIAVDLNEKKVVIYAHSMGAPYGHYFLKWVESEKGGKGGDRWVHNHIHAVVNIGGPLLGLPKSSAALASGEFKETALLGPLDGNLGGVGPFFDLLRRRSLWQTWGSLHLMMPVGGEAIWGNHTWAPDDLIGNNLTTYGDLFACAREGQSEESMTVEGAEKEVRRVGPMVEKWLDSDFYKGFVDNPQDPKYDESKYWTNILSQSLPYAPEMSIYCLYGTGLPAERGYYYMESDAEGYPKYVIDKSQNYWNDGIAAGVRTSDGDATVPLLSLSYPCVSLWNGTTPHNPSGMKIVTKEYPNAASAMGALLGNQETGDHIGILGNQELQKDLAFIAAGHNEEVQTRVESAAYDIAENIDRERKRRT
eukprot:Clim_evm19s51 gene=Clim_evmTU19s51